MVTAKPPGICALESCDNPLGPDALEFQHKGQDVGGICEICLARLPSIRVLFVKDGDDLFKIEEMVPINSPASG